MRIKLGRCYIARNGDLVIITGFQPSKKFNKYIGYIITEHPRDNHYQRISMLMSWGSSGDYWSSAISSKHDLISLAESRVQPLLALDMIKII